MYQLGHKHAFKRAKHALAVSVVDLEDADVGLITETAITSSKTRKQLQPPDVEYNPLMAFTRFRLFE